MDYLIFNINKTLICFILTNEVLIKYVIILILLIPYLFLISAIGHSIINGKYLTSYVVLSFNRLIIPLRILEQANADAYIKIRFTNSFEHIKIYKRQNDKSWWYESQVAPQNLRFFTSIESVKKIQNDIQLTNDNIQSELEDGVKLGSNIEAISEIVYLYFHKVNKCSRQSKIRIGFFKARVETSMVEDIINK